MNEKKLYIIAERKIGSNLLYQLDKIYKPISLTEEEAMKMVKELNYKNAINIIGPRYELINIDLLDSYQHTFSDKCVAKLNCDRNVIYSYIINEDINYLKHLLNQPMYFNIINEDNCKKHLKKYNLSINDIDGDAILLSSSKFDFPIFTPVIILYLLNIHINLDVSIKEFESKIMDMIIHTAKNIFKTKFDNNVDKILSRDWEYYVFNRNEV